MISAASLQSASSNSRQGRESFSQFGSFTDKTFFYLFISLAERFPAMLPVPKHRQRNIHCTKTLEESEKRLLTTDGSRFYFGVELACFCLHSQYMVFTEFTVTGSCTARYRMREFCDCTEQSLECIHRFPQAFWHLARTGSIGAAVRMVVFQGLKAVFSCSSHRVSAIVCTAENCLRSIPHRAKQSPQYFGKTAQQQ